jgi:hypothetical protein
MGCSSILFLRIFGLELEAFTRDFWEVLIDEGPPVLALLATLLMASTPRAGSSSKLSSLL